jgi:hypothetical protein
MKLTTIAFISALTLGAAATHAQDKPSYPAEIQKDLEEAQKECAEADDGKVTVKPGFVRKLDLTGDKRADYIVNFDELQCSTFESIFCGTGGCQHLIYVTTKDGTLRNVFSGRVRLYEVSKAPGAKTVTFHLHGGYCGKAGTYDCVKKRRITEQKFEFKDR